LFTNVFVFFYSIPLKELRANNRFCNGFRGLIRHMRNGFIPWIRALGWNGRWQKPRIENRMTLFL
jgi:hypothetical protein